MDAICRPIYTHCQQVAPSPGFAIQMRPLALHCPLVPLHGQPLAVSAHECLVPVYDLLERTGQPWCWPPTTARQPCATPPMYDYGQRFLCSHPRRIMLGMIALQSDRPVAFSARSPRSRCVGRRQLPQAAVLLQQQRAAQLLLIAEVGRKVAAIRPQDRFHDTVRWRDTLAIITSASTVLMMQRRRPGGQQRSRDRAARLDPAPGHSLIGHTAQQGEPPGERCAQQRPMSNEIARPHARRAGHIPLRREPYPGVLDLQSDAPQAFTTMMLGVDSSDQIAVPSKTASSICWRNSRARHRCHCRWPTPWVSQHHPARVSQHRGRDHAAPVEVDWCLVLVWPA